jgi:4-amino-4-deoxy-L-arabinose transferase-like glycosyltransferase
VLAIALVLRVAGALAHARQGPVTQPDEANYLLVARSLVEHARFATHPGGPPEVIRGPVYPLFLAPFVRGFGTSLTAPLLAQALLGTLTAGVLALALGRALVRAGRDPDRARRAAAWTAMALALSPIALTWERLLMSEGLATALAAIGVAAWMETPHAARPWRFVLAAGLAFGLLALAKPAYLALPLVLAVVSLRDLARAGRLACAAGLVAAALLPVVPWTARNLSVLGRPVPVGLGSGLFLYAATLPQGEGGVPLLEPGDAAAVARYLNHDTPVAERLALDDDFRARARARLRERPLAYLGLCARRAARLWASSHADGLRPWAVPEAVRWTIALALGATFGLAAVAPLRLGRAPGWALAPFAAVPAYATLIHAVMLSGSRYSVVAWPFVLALATCAAAGREAEGVP